MLKGSLVALITPFRNGAVDEKAFQNFVAWQIAQGTHGEAIQLRTVRGVDRPNAVIGRQRGPVARQCAASFDARDRGR